MRNSAELQQAVTQAEPGDRIELAPGTYRGGFHFTRVQGAEGRPIVITATDPKRPPRIEGGGTGMHFVDPAWLELSHLVIEGARVNGLNLDDGGSFDTPAHHITLHHLQVRRIGRQGNEDGIKLSGVTDFRVAECVIEYWGTGGGSAIDMVGCHRGLIVSNRFHHADFRSCTGVQAKGGSADVAVRANVFDDAGARAVNIGGSTGLRFFRPPLTGQGPFAEARRILVECNVFIRGQAAVAFVGVDGAVVRFNTIYRPRRWALRILQENRAPGFVSSRRGQFTDNLVVFTSADWHEGGVNIGPHTAPETFAFARNWWYCLDRPERSRPRLPAPEVGGVYGRKVRFRDPDRGDFRLAPGQPACPAGAHAWRP